MNFEYFDLPSTGVRGYWLRWLTGHELQAGDYVVSGPQNATGLVATRDVDEFDKEPLGTTKLAIIVWDPYSHDDSLFADIKHNELYLAFRRDAHLDKHWETHAHAVDSRASQSMGSTRKVSNHGEFETS